MLELANRGHNVLVYTPFPNNVTSVKANYAEVDCSECFRHISYLRVPVKIDYVYDSMTNTDVASTMRFFFGNIENVAKATLRCEPVLKLLLTTTTKQSFDLSITEMFHNDVNVALVSKLNAPYIAFHSAHLLPWLATNFANPFSPSYVNVADGYRSNMCFVERVRNTYVYLLSLLLYERYSRAVVEKIVEQFPGPALAYSLETIAKNASLLFIHTNSAVNSIQPLVPAIVEVGGINILKASPLPQVSPLLAIFIFFPLIRFEDIFTRL